MPESPSENDSLRELVAALADRAGLGEEHRQALDIAASLLSVGRLPLVDILEKKGALSSEEIARIRDIPKIWADFVGQLSPLKALGVPEIVEAYCESWDGSGYPKGLAGDEIPFGARLLAVCYRYNGMISDRPHRRALPGEEAVAEVRQMSGKVLDPALVETFARMVEEKLGPARRDAGPKATPVPAKKGPEKKGHKKKIAKKEATAPKKAKKRAKKKSR